MQWFAILHECGHETLFRTQRLHAVVGQVAGFFSLIPFYNWKRVHGRHHKWTGWQDVDPTTATLVPRELETRSSACWSTSAGGSGFRCSRCSIASTTSGTGRGFGRCSRSLKTAAGSRASSIALLAAYVAIVVARRTAARCSRSSGSALLLALIAEDLLLLSQHTHIPQQLSHGEPVRPFPTIEQEVFTRSLVFPRWLSALLLHIDAHELHHMYPFVPGYRLGGVAYETENEIGVWTWIRGARAMPGELFLFHNRLETGADI